MLSLHLLQNCMVFINTLMLQQVLADPIGPTDSRRATKSPSRP